MLILAVETSCDDAAAAMLRSETPGIAQVLSSVVSSQDSIHEKFGGVVPELASRQHLVSIVPVVQGALENAGCTLDDVEGLAVTRGPGLTGSLLVGLMFAKALAQSRKVPMVGVNHIEGHLLAPMLEHAIEMPYLALGVSGGHTSLFVVENFGRYTRLGRTRDDAAGEAFDKVAKLMGLGYPGGRIIDRLAKTGNVKKMRFPRARVRGAPYDFSFSGIKTAVALFVRSEEGTRTTPSDLAASFQEAVVDMLERPTLAAAREYDLTTIALTGGVAANSRLRSRLENSAAQEGRRVIAPSPRYCTDNAAMIGLAGSYR